MLYARATRGFKNGGYNEAKNSGDESRFEFEDEEATSYELGAKLRLLDNTASLNAALFYTDYQDRQVSAFSGTNFVVGNAAESTTRGIEINSQWRANERLTFGLSIAYLDSEFDSFKGAGCTAAQTAVSVGGCTQDISGERTEFSPEETANFSMEYVMPVTDSLNITFQLDGNYSDDYFFAQDLDAFESQDAFTKLNARIGLGDGKWELMLLGKNLTDEEVLSHGNDIPLFNGAHFSFLERPRTVAIQGKYQF